MMPNQPNPAANMLGANAGAPGTPGVAYRRPNFLDTESAESYGLADKFIATITDALFVAYDYQRLAQKQKGKQVKGQDGYRLCVALYMTADPGQGLESLDPTYYSAAPLYFFVPSTDGVNPAGQFPPDRDPWHLYDLLANGKTDILHAAAVVDATGKEIKPAVPYEHSDIKAFGGYFVAPVGGYDAQGAPKHSGFDVKSDWMLFLQKAKECRMPIDANLFQTRGLAALIGHRGRFDRIPRPGSTDPKAKVLLMTEYLGFNGAGQAGQGTAAPSLMAVSSPAQAVAPAAYAPAPAPAPAAVDPNVAANAARITSSTDPIDNYLRSTLAAAGGRATLTQLIERVKDFPDFRGNEVLAQQTRMVIFNPAQIMQRGFGFDVPTATASLPGM